MTRPVDLALQRQLQAPASKMAATALWVLGLITASVATTLLVAVSQPLSLPPAPGLHLHNSKKNGYFLLALSGAFFAGVAGVMAAVWVGANDDPRRRGRPATGRKKLVVCSAAVGGGLVVVSLLW